MFTTGCHKSWQRWISPLAHDTGKYLVWILFRGLLSISKDRVRKGMLQVLAKMNNSLDCYLVMRSRTETIESHVTQLYLIAQLELVRKSIHKASITRQEQHQFGKLELDPYMLPHGGDWTTPLSPTSPTYLRRTISRKPFRPRVCGPPLNSTIWAAPCTWRLDMAKSPSEICTRKSKR